MRSFTQGLRVAVLSVLFAVCCMPALRAYAASPQADQKISISVKDMPLREFLANVEQKCDYTFFYSSSVLENAGNVTVNAENETVGEILKQVLDGTGRTFEIVGDKIAIKLAPKSKGQAAANTDVQNTAAGAGLPEKPHSVSGTILDENGRPMRLDAVVLSTQHDENVSQEQIHKDIKAYVFDEILPGGMVDENTKFYINPTGRFVIGGPHGDSGLTGRKIIVDTYGGYARHGGGAFSGKDCTKVDRSASYAARYAAKNIVASGLAEKCEVQLSYAIGVAQPTSIMVDTFGTGKLSDERITEIVRENFDFRPAGIIKELTLRRPIYRQTAAYGHFGREDVDLPWERLDKANELKKYL